MLSFSKTYRNVLFQTLRLNMKRNLIISLLTFISCMVIFSIFNFIARSPENLLANFIGSLLGILAFQLSLLLFTGITTWNQVRETRNKLQEHPDDLPTWHIDDLRLYYTDETILNYIHTKGDNNHV